MSYTKLVPALVRANSAHIKRIRIAPGRFRSTVASTQQQELADKDQSIDECAVETVPVELISQTTCVNDAQAKKITIDFDNTLEAYKSKDNIELLRSLLVFKMCTIDFLVDKNKEVSRTCAHPDVRLKMSNFTWVWMVASACPAYEQF